MSLCWITGAHAWLLKKHGKWSAPAIWHDVSKQPWLWICRGAFDEASQDALPCVGAHLPAAFLQWIQERISAVGLKEAKGGERLALNHSCSSHWAAVLTYASSISSGVCISSRKLLPPGEKGRRWRRPGRCYKTSFLQLIKPPRTTYILSPPNEGTQSQNPVLLYY